MAVIKTPVQCPLCEGNFCETCHFTGLVYQIEILTEQEYVAKQLNEYNKAQTIPVFTPPQWQQPPPYPSTGGGGTAGGTHWFPGWTTTTTTGPVWQSASSTYQNGSYVTYNSSNLETDDESDNTLEFDIVEEYLKAA